MGDNTNTNVTGNNVQETKVEAFKIVIDEHEKFDPLVETQFTTSTEFCKLVSDLFRAVFPDCVGSSLDMIPATNIQTISLYFDHLDHGDQQTAVSRDAGDQKTKNSTLKSTRNYYTRLRVGDKYLLTDDGKSAIVDFLMDPDCARAIYNNNYEVKWDKITTDVADPSAGMSGRQLTKVSFIDPNKLAAAIYGETNFNEDKVVYNIRNLGSLPVYVGGYSSAGYSLAVDRVTEANVHKMSAAYGIGANNGLNIIR